MNMDSIPRLSRTNQRGFTLVELVMTIVILGILSAVVAPKLFDNSVFQSRGFADQVLATLRYAQKTAIAQHRYVCAAFSSNSVTLTYGTTSTCGTALISPVTGVNYVVNAPGGIVFSSTPANFSFDTLGRSNIATLGVIGSTSITVELETGYVH